jgi:hypothetical protein
MSKPLPTPVNSAELTNVLAQQIDAALESGDFSTGEEAIIVVKFTDVMPHAWWLEATAIVTVMFASRDVFLTFIFKKNIAKVHARGVTIRYITP